MGAHLETPCIVIDTKQTNKNIAGMAAIAEKHQVKLRPHAKTHKMPAVAHKQLQAGANGITVAKLSEAEVMVEHGVTDIFIAYPVVSRTKIKRALKLSRTMRLILAVDSLEGAKRLAEVAEELGHPLEVRLEIDTGMHRTGASPAQAIGLAKQIKNLEDLRLTGIFTFRGALMNERPTLDLEQAGREEGEMMVRLANEMRAEGIPIEDVSVGSTPTSAYAAAVAGVTEIRPGTYVFQDRMQAKFGVCSLEDCAATVVVTVVSRPSQELVVVDGGSKTFATDVQPNTEPLRLAGFGHVIGAPDAVLERLSEEHGMIRIPAECSWQVGDQLRIIPNHICSTINLHNQVYWSDGGQLETMRVFGRGMLE